MKSVVAILTDFGHRDWYVASMKGVIASANPDATFIDITNDVTPCSIIEAAFALKACYRFFPDRTVFLVVVDPGVGTTRRPIALRAGNWFFVGPDNGVFGLVLEEQRKFRCVELRLNRTPESTTFHGRDVFAPAAAQLSMGATLEKLGFPAPDPFTLSLPHVKYVSKNEILGEIIHVDRFGNLITNVRIAGPGLARNSRNVSAISFPRKRVSISRMCRSYAELGPVEPGIMVGSAGYLEIALFGQSASARLGIAQGEPFCLMLKGRENPNQSAGSRSSR